MLIFASPSSIDKTKGESYKNSVVPKMWGRERLKVEKSIGKWSQNAFFANFPLKFLLQREVFGREICN